MQDSVTTLVEGFKRLTPRQKATAYLVIEEIWTDWRRQAPREQLEPSGEKH
jgi:hypothetical protein